MKQYFRGPSHELKKFASLPLFRFFALSAALITAIVAFFLTWSFGQGPNNPAANSASLANPLAIRALYTGLASWGPIIPLLLGALLAVTEFEYRTIRQTFLAQPNRLRVVLDKAQAAFVIGLALGVICIVISTLVITVYLKSRSPAVKIPSESLGLALLHTALGWGLSGILGLGLGLVLRRQTRTIIGILLGSQLVEPLLRVLLPQLTGSATIAAYLPGAVIEGITGASLYQVGMRTNTDLLTPALASLVLFLYVAATLVWGISRTQRYDVP